MSNDKNSNVSKNSVSNTNVIDMTKLQTIEDCNSAFSACRDVDAKQRILMRLQELLAVKESAIKHAQTTHSRKASESSYAYLSALYLLDHSVSATSTEFAEYIQSIDAQAKERPLAQAFSQVKSAFSALISRNAIKESMLAQTKKQ